MEKGSPGVPRPAVLTGDPHRAQKRLPGASSAMQDGQLDIQYGDWISFLDEE